MTPSFYAPWLARSPTLLRSSRGVFAAGASLVQATECPAPPQRSTGRGDCEALANERKEAVSADLVKLPALIFSF